MKVLTRFQGELLKEYNRTRKRLRTHLKRPMAPAEVKIFIKEAFKELTERQAVIIARYIYKVYKSGTAEAKKEIKGVTISAAAASPLSAVALSDTVGVDLDSVSQKQMYRIMHHNLGAIGKYNINLSKVHQHQFNLLLNDNKLLSSLDTYGWTPWLEEEWKKRGIAPEVIKLIKGQKTSAQMINILEWQGIRGGMHPNEVAKSLIPHINRFFGPEGVVIDNVGKSVDRLTVDADGNFEWVRKKIKKVYRASPRTYSRMLARNVLREARMDAYYDSLLKSNLVDHYISVAHMDSNTCAHCAMMHGQTVTKGTGPQYHGNCGCDLRPVWKKDSPLASQNKPDAFYEKQRDMHFLRMDDLKRYNAKMPRGMKLKYATQLPQDAITKVMPGKTKMRAIRHRMLGEPKKITPAVEKAKAVQKVELTKRQVVTKKLEEQPWGMSDKDWKVEAKNLYAKTAKDGLEHAKTFNDAIAEYVGKATEISYQSPYHDHWAMHTHPNWDSPLSDGDFLNFIFTPSKRVSAAASKEHIYLIRKTPGARGVPEQSEIKKFRRAWKAAQKKIGMEMSAHELTLEDHRQIYIKVNKKFAEKYGLEYKIIDR